MWPLQTRRPELVQSCADLVNDEFKTPIIKAVDHLQTCLLSVRAKWERIVIFKILRHIIIYCFYWSLKHFSFIVLVPASISELNSWFDCSLGGNWAWKFCCKLTNVSVEHSSVCNFPVSVITALLCQFLWALNQSLCAAVRSSSTHTHTHTHTHTKLLQIFLILSSVSFFSVVENLLHARNARF